MLPRWPSRISYLLLIKFLLLSKLLRHRIHYSQFILHIKSLNELCDSYCPTYYQLIYLNDSYLEIYSISNSKHVHPVTFHHHDASCSSSKLTSRAPWGDATNVFDRMHYGVYIIFLVLLWLYKLKIYCDSYFFKLFY